MATAHAYLHGVRLAYWGQGRGSSFLISFKLLVLALRRLRAEQQFGPLCGPAT